MILFTFVAILFIFILNTITIGKTGSCKSFISRILSQSILVNQIFKQIFLSFISCYIIQFIHKQLDEFFFKNLTSIYDSLFSHLNTVVDNSLNQKDAIYENLTVEINRSSKLKIECFIAVLFFISSTVELVLISKIVLISIWTVSFLIVNFIVVSGVLLVRYFPYQIINDSRNSNNNKALFFFLTKEELPLIRQQSKTIVKDEDDDTENIDETFLEYQHELRNQALIDMSLTFGSNQPSLKSAFKALKGFIIFVSCTLIVSVVLSHLKILNSIKISLLFLILFILLIVTLFQIVIAFIFIVRNTRETIFIKQLNVKSPFT